MRHYDPKEIETKWQKVWEEQQTYKADLNGSKPKYYGFGMFNYPSGNSIHLGHAKNFTIPDVLLRFKRQQGYEAYSPVGFDSFGLPAENYAIKTGTSPRETTDEAIASYRKQYRRMGWGMDWSKEIDTSKPEYYQWTQWCFLQLYKNDLAYQNESLQWWCDQCKTVLADEQVTAGKCWRHDGDDDPFVTKKSLRQWFFKITDYADEILEATDGLDWTPWVKTAQKNWIGRSEGTVIDFPLEGLGTDGQNLDVFTTAVETIFGVTFMVLAPEHPIVTNFAQHADNAQEIDEYVQHALRKSELDREKERVKTGVPIKGLTATNPANGQKIPVWIADYVLMGYGSGAIMAVPGQDERDFAFAEKYELPIVYTTDKGEFVNYAEEIKPEPRKYKMANSGEFDGQDLKTARGNITKKLVNESRAEEKVQYKMRDWLISRQRYWGAPIPIIHCETCGVVPVPEEELPVKLPEIDDYHPSGTGESPLAKAREWVNVACPECGKQARRETDTMDGYVCSSWYQLRYLSPKDNQKAWNPELAQKWLPVDFYNGGDHATAHLLYARFFTRFFHKLGLTGTPEPFERMYFHAKILAEDGSFFSKSKGNGIDPLEVIDSGYGADALRTYILFLAPPDVESPWNSQGLPSCYRFLNRLWTLTQEFLNGEAQQGETSEDLARATHQVIKKVTEDIEAIKYNTAIAGMMECINALYKLKDSNGFVDQAGWRFALESLTQLVAPFAPHIASELWEQLGHEDSVHIDHWPSWDESKLVQSEITVVVQVNGKVRANVNVAADADKQTVLDAAKAEDNVQSHLGDNEIKKEIYVPGKLVNFVI
ncbi:MAG: leucine--tRNA ligase [Candidatus Saccharibacteria bacterium]|nr:leucine--tRNA ligase [Candidatus Saccharibacteria bacterium]